jgi:hypothetical protein
VPPNGVWSAWVNYWFTPSNVLGLHTLRVIAGVLFLTWLLSFSFHVEEFFGLNGWFDTQAYADAARLPEGPPQPFGWSLLYLCGSDSALLNMAYVTGIIVLTLFTLGVWTRLTAPLTWMVVASFSVTPVIADKAEALLTVLAFYLAVGYLFLNQLEPGQSMAARILGSRDNRLLWRATTRAPSVAATIAIRLLQIHWAAIVLIGGLQKLQSGGWWAGWSLWYPLHPPFETTMADVRNLAPHGNAYMSALSLAAYATLAWQIGFPFFAWQRRCRLVLLGGAVTGWVWMSWVEGDPFLGPALLVGCLAYITADEWKRAFTCLSSLPGMDWLRSHATLGAAEPKLSTHAT